MISKAELEEIRARYNWADRDSDMWPDEPLEVSFRDIPTLITSLEEAWASQIQLEDYLDSAQEQIELLGGENNQLRAENKRLHDEGESMWAESVRLWAALDKCAYSVFEVKRMGHQSDAVYEHCTKAHQAACAVLDTTHGRGEALKQL